MYEYKVTTRKKVKGHHANCRLSADSLRTEQHNSKRIRLQASQLVATNVSALPARTRKTNDTYPSRFLVCCSLVDAPTKEQHTRKHQAHCQSSWTMSSWTAQAPIQGLTFISTAYVWRPQPPCCLPPVLLMLSSDTSLSFTAHQPQDEQHLSHEWIIHSSDQEHMPEQSITRISRSELSSQGHTSMIKVQTSPPKHYATAILILDMPHHR